MGTAVDRIHKLFFSETKVDCTILMTTSCHLQKNETPETRQNPEQEQGRMDLCPADHGKHDGAVAVLHGRDGAGQLDLLQYLLHDGVTVKDTLLRRQIHNGMANNRI